jgi:hypothetical protein
MSFLVMIDDELIKVFFGISMRIKMLFQTNRGFDYYFKNCILQ